MSSKVKIEKMISTMAAETGAAMQRQVARLREKPLPFHAVWETDSNEAYSLVRYVEEKLLRANARFPFPFSR